MEVWIHRLPKEPLSDALYMYHTSSVINKWWWWYAWYVCVWRGGGGGGRGGEGAREGEGVGTWRITSQKVIGT